MVGELIEECVVIAFNESCPEKVNLFNEISLSHQTIGRIDDLADSIMGILQTQLSKCVHYSLALDICTDQSDTAQLVIFIRGIDVNFNIIEGMLGVCHMKGTTTGRNMTEHVNLSLEKFNVDRNKINSIATHAATVLTGKNNGFITLFKEMVDHDILSYHCLIHQQQLCAQKLNMKQLITDIVNVVNFIRSWCLDHRTFRAYLVEVGSEYKDVIYFSKIR
ncbi:general transcription factor II-I repeat domain-containing protein 2 [Octopus bimaculoides]|uniref:general transcription factor II-I repeat domain-containing protein 2 n=1 Tax=Octopus bimaculoides TaxID=37653 RepID=UPI00071D11BB|nr:general transcription factor II-I repeat domain-containing protein 2 [Octopus bimaculoides]|eukprot:XP_014789099.1 PREDICTED: general transcription factor II-I repeat domain-containing protein 2-like [Octopus bimaculoides]